MDTHHTVREMGVLFQHPQDITGDTQVNQDKYMVHNQMGVQKNNNSSALIGTPGNVGGLGVLSIHRGTRSTAQMTV